MKKIKLLFLALLGISIIPTAANALKFESSFGDGTYTVSNSFSPRLINREVVFPYNFKGTLNADQCPSGDEYSPKKMQLSSHFTPGQKIYYKKQKASYFRWSPAVYNENTKTFLVGLDFSSLQGFNLEDVILTYKPNALETITTQGGGSHQYRVAMLGEFGVDLYNSVSNELNITSVILNSYMFDGYYFSFKGINNYPLHVIDTYNNKIYFYENFNSDNFFTQFNFLSFFKLFYNSSPTHIQEYSYGGNIDFVYYQKWRKVNYNLKREITPEEIAAHKAALKSRLLVMPRAKPLIQVSFKELGLETNEELSQNNNSVAEYNQCLAYYNSVKTYASYDRNCYKDLLDNNQDIGLRQQITDWDGEGEGPATDNRICNLRKGYKKSYKTKFKDKWSEFLELSSANRLSPYSLNVKDYCGERPKIEENKGFFEGIKDFFTGRTGDPLMIGDDGKNYYEGDFADDWEKLRDLYWKCKGLNKRGLMQSATLTEQEKTQACSDYQSEKTKFLKKWEHATIPKFYGGGLPAAIHAIEQSGIGTGGILEKLKKDVSNSVIGDSFSYVGEEIFGRIKGPFYSGYNSVLSLNCASSSIPHIEIMDYIAMGAFALMAFILFKLL